MSEIIDSYKSEDGDCFTGGCEDCVMMSRSGYDNAGCYTHKLEVRVGKLKDKLYYQDIVIDTIREMKEINSEAHPNSLAMRSAVVRAINAFNTFKKLYPDEKDL